MGQDEGAGSLTESVLISTDQRSNRASRVFICRSSGARVRRLLDNISGDRSKWLPARMYGVGCRRVIAKVSEVRRSPGPGLQGGMNRCKGPGDRTRVRMSGIP